MKKALKKWYFQVLSAAISLIAAAVVLGNPLGTTAVLWMFTAISLIVKAVVDLVGMVLEGKGE